MRREEDGYPVYQETFLRQSIKEFPFPRPLVSNYYLSARAMHIFEPI